MFSTLTKSVFEIGDGTNLFSKQLDDYLKGIHGFVEG